VKPVFKIIFPLLLFFNVSFAQNPFIKRYSIENGLPTNKIYQAIQDREGFLWFASDAGVIRFDGTHFVDYTMDDGLSDNIVRKVKEDNSGRVWFFNYNGTVNYFYKNTIYNASNDPLLKDLKADFFFLDFYQDTDSTLYFYNAVSEVLVVKNGQLVDFMDFGLNNTKNIGLFYLNKSPEGKLLLWSATGIFECESLDDSLKLYRQPVRFQRVFPKGELETFVLDWSGNIHFYNNSGVAEKEVIKTGMSYINSIIADKDGFIWLATFDRGVYCCQDGEVILHLDIELAQSLLEDQENNIWAVSNKNGIYKINRDILKYNYLEKGHFGGKGVSEMAHANSEGIWATNGSSLYWVRRNQVFPLQQKLQCNILENIYHLKNNTLLASGIGMELNVIENVRFDSHSNSILAGKSYKQGYRVRRFAVDHSEQFVYSFINENLIKAKIGGNYSCLFYRMFAGNIFNVFFDHNDSLTVNASGNYTFNVDRLFEIEALKPIKGRSIVSQIVLDGKNEVLNVNGNELYLLNDTSLYNLTDELDFKVGLSIKDLAYDGSNLFFSTVKTVYFIPNPLNIISQKPIELNSLNIEFNNINDLLFQDSTLYVATDDGLTMIPAKDCGKSPVLPSKPYFNHILLNDKEIDISSSGIKFKGKNKLSLEFSSLNYSSFPMKYSYKLEGYDKNWAIGDETNVVYLNLPPGSYIFKLQSKKTGEVKSNTIELPITVKPTLFQRPAAWIFLSLFCLIVLILAIVYFKNRQIKQKETESQLLSLENKALQSMMNPHFIFNSLGSIQSYLLQNRSVEASTYLSQFARLIRQNMNSLKSNFISIDDEVERLRNYLELEKIRTNTKFDFKIDVDTQLDGDEIGIPSMIVQPFAENAVWHGISSLPGNGIINIRFLKNDEKSILIFIEDNGIGIESRTENSKSGQHLHMGMSLTEKRIKLIGEQLHVKSEIITEKINPGLPNPGTRVKLLVPVLTDENRV